MHRNCIVKSSLLDVYREVCNDQISLVYSYFLLYTVCGTFISMSAELAVCLYLKPDHTAYVGGNSN